MGQMGKSWCNNGLKLDQEIFTLTDSVSSRVEVKVKCPCALTEHHAMKAYWGSGVIGRRTKCIKKLGDYVEK
jgi:hypothetical protein